MMSALFVFPFLQDNGYETEISTSLTSLVERGMLWASKYVQEREKAW